MSYSMLSEIKSSILKKISLSEVDKMLKSGTFSNSSDFSKKLNDLIDTETKSYVQKLTKSEFEYLQYYINVIIENTKKIVISALYEDGFVAADAFVEYRIGLNIINNDYSKYVDTSEKSIEK